MSDREPESRVALERARAAQRPQSETLGLRGEVFALAVLHATELHKQLQDVPQAERQQLEESYLADLRDELAAVRRNGRASERLLKAWRAATGLHSVRAEVRTLRRVK